MTWFIRCLSPDAHEIATVDSFPNMEGGLLFAQWLGSLLQVELVSFQGLMWGRKNSILMLYLLKTHFHISTYICLCACTESCFC